MNKNLTAIVDLDSMLHIIANVQYSAGNRDNSADVRNHVRRFIANICTNATNKEVILLYQNTGHTNFRNIILPEYKSHREASDAIKLWKSTILEAYAGAGALALNHIESDDAQNILARLIGLDRTVLVTSDKDIQQVPTMLYNPYKKNLKPEDRWRSMSIYESNRFFWMQVLAGDPTDMPGELCGLEGVGMSKADKLCDQQLPFQQIIQEAYTKQYGGAGFKRANVTYKMVRLLGPTGNDYINPEAAKEVQFLIDNYKNYIQEVSDPKNTLFASDPLNLFTNG